MLNNKWETLEENTIFVDPELSSSSPGSASRMTNFGPSGNCGFLGVARPERIPPTGFDAQRSCVASLCDSLVALGIIETPDCGLLECPESVLSLVWKIVSECNRRSRAWDVEKEKFARCDNDNKLMKSRIARLTEELGKLRNEMSVAELEYRRKEDNLHKQLEEVGRNRSEWEKAALCYKGREQKFVAEVKRHENDYEKLKDRMKRSISMTGTRGRVSLNDRRTGPPPLVSRRFSDSNQDSFAHFSHY